MNRRILLFAGVTLAISGCNGEIHSKAWTPEALKAAMSAPGGIKGVFVYFPKSMVETDRLTQVTDKDGKFVTSDCNQVDTNKIVSIADQDNPIQIWYEPGFLEANQFSVQLVGGMITSVNSQSSPDQGKTLGNIASAATNFAKLGAAATQAPSTGPLPVPGKVNCNATPTFIGLAPLQVAAQ